jgi:elongation factor 3
MPAVTDSKPTASMSSKENQASAKVLDELMAKLTISKEQDQINEATHNLSVFINGDIETKDAPTKYVFSFLIFPAS